MALDCQAHISKVGCTVLVKPIVCGGMRRAASRFQYYTIAEIARRRGDIPLGWVKWQDFDELYKEHNTPENKGRRIVVKSHSHLPHFTKLKIREWDVVTSHRDLRDVMGSIKAIFPDKKWDKQSFWVELDTVVSEFDRWAGVACAISRYDDIISDPGIQVHNWSLALGYSMSLVEAEEIASKYSLEKMQNMGEDGKTNYVPLGDGSPKRHLLDQVQMHIIEEAWGPWLKKWGYAD